MKNLFPYALCLCFLLSTGAAYAVTAREMYEKAKAVKIEVFINLEGEKMVRFPNEQFSLPITYAEYKRAVRSLQKRMETPRFQHTGTGSPTAWQPKVNSSNNFS